MKCPNCSITAQRWEKKCLSCGVVFLEFYEKRARDSQREARLKREEPVPEVPSGGFPRGAGLALAVGLLLSSWAAVRYRAQSLSPRAYQQKNLEIAFTPPEGWRLKADMGSGWRFRRVAELIAEGGRIEVDAAPPKLPVAENMGELIREEFNGRHPRVESSMRALIDGIECRKMAFSAENGPQQPGIVGEAMFIPGKQENYLIRFYSNSADISRRRPEWRTFLSSIRRTRK